MCSSVLYGHAALNSKNASLPPPRLTHGVGLVVADAVLYAL